MTDKSVTERETGELARSEVDTFLANLKTRAGPSTRGRLIFALDATASREATWDTACKLQGEMFQEAGSLGGNAVGLLSRPGRVPGLALDV